LGDELQCCLRKKIKRRQKNDSREGGGWSTVPVRLFRVALTVYLGYQVDCVGLHTEKCIVI
jgi:hypothetical protein